VVWLRKQPSASVNKLLPNRPFRHVPTSSRRLVGSRSAERGQFGPLQMRTWAVRALAAGTLALAASALSAQTASGSPDQTQPSARTKAGTTNAGTKTGTKIAAIKSFRIIQEKSGPAVEILATHPIIPSIQQINDPTRLVIDLPNARLDTTHRRISVQADQITTLRADQFQENPPVARVVVDLLAPRTYTWDSAGNRLVVHLGKDPTEASHSPFQAPTVASLTPTPEPIVKAVRSAGPLTLAANTANVGSAFTAGAETAVISLSSGGEVRVCPGTTMSITPSQNKHNLLLGMNTGALEAHLQLDASSDLVMTPDFRILLVGPGEFHYAFSADSQGNTCVRALPGNTASAIVTELLGERTYQVKATDQLVFHSGQLDRVDMAVPLECGCPPARPAVERASNDLSVQSQTASEVLPPVNKNPAQRMDSSSTDSSNGGIPASNSAQIVAPPPVSNELHVQISAPLVFNATGPPPAPVEDVRALPLDVRGMQVSELSVAPSPPANGQSGRPAGGSADNHPRGFFHKLGHVFSSMFH
jgi:hypothetical protein